MDKDARQIISIIIGRYPRRRQEYEQMLKEVIQDGVAKKSLYLDTLETEIAAIDAVCSQLTKEEQQIIETRFWRNSNKLTPHEQIAGKSKVVCDRVIWLVGLRLGEIRRN